MSERLDSFVRDLDRSGGCAVNGWRFTRKAPCSEHGRSVQLRFATVNGAAPPPGYLGVRPVSRCGACKRPVDDRLEALVVAGDVTWFTARAVAMERFRTDELLSEPSEGPVDVWLAWDGSDAGSRPSRHLVVADADGLVEAR